MLTFDFVVKILIVLFGSKLIIESLIKFIIRDRRQTYSITLVNLLLGLSLSIFILVPNIARFINTEILGFGENFNTLIFLLIISIFFILIKLYKRIDEKERMISKLVREIALKDALD